MNKTRIDGSFPVQLCKFPRRNGVETEKSPLCGIGNGRGTIYDRDIQTIVLSFGFIVYIQTAYQKTGVISSAGTKKLFSVTYNRKTTTNNSNTVNEFRFIRTIPEKLLYMARNHCFGQRK